MGYEIVAREQFVEVLLEGETSSFEVMRIVKELARRDPVKKMPDLWMVSGESQVPLPEFSDIARAVGSLLPSTNGLQKTALVAAGELQKAELELYRSEADGLPFPIRVFRSRDRAVAWLTAGEAVQDAQA